MKAKASSLLTPCLRSSPAHSAHDTRFRHLPMKDKNEKNESNEGSIEISPCRCSSLWSPCRANHPISQGDFLCNTKGRRRSWVNTQKSYKTANNSSTVGFVASVYVSKISHQIEPHKSRSCSILCKKSKKSDTARCAFSLSYQWSARLADGYFNLHINASGMSSSRWPRMPRANSEFLHNFASKGKAP